jgi:hypothetical protein
MEKMMENYVRTMGIEKYEQKIVGLINQMPNMADAPVGLVMGTPSSTTDLSELPSDA